MRLISTLVTYESSQKSHPFFLEFATSGTVSWWKWIFFLNRRHFALENWVGHCVHDVLCFVTSNFATKGIVCIIQCHCKLNSLDWITSHCNSNLFDISEEMSEATTIQEKAFFLLYTLIGRDSWTIWYGPYHTEHLLYYNFWSPFVFFDLVALFCETKFRVHGFMFIGCFTVYWSAHILMVSFSKALVGMMVRREITTSRMHICTSSAFY